jgi:hypothetical protein
MKQVSKLKEMIIKSKIGKNFPGKAISRHEAQFLGNVN